MRLPAATAAASHHALTQRHSCRACLPARLLGRALHARAPQHDERAPGCSSAPVALRSCVCLAASASFPSSLCPSSAPRLGYPRRAYLPFPSVHSTAPLHASIHASMQPLASVLPALPCPACPALLARPPCHACTHSPLPDSPRPPGNGTGRPVVGQPACHVLLRAVLLLAAAALSFTR